jgi:hypothetical protein
MHQPDEALVVQAFSARRMLPPLVRQTLRHMSYPELVFPGCKDYRHSTHFLQAGSISP